MSTWSKNNVNTLTNVWINYSKNFINKMNFLSDNAARTVQKLFCILYPELLRIIRLTIPAALDILNTFCFSLESIYGLAADASVHFWCAPKTLLTKHI